MNERIIGNYKITQKLGEGGMGAVYKGIDLMLEREVAIKALRPELAASADVVERFRSEAVTLAKLIHPNISTLHSFFREGDEFFMVMEYLRGATLEAELAARGALPVDVALPLFAQALDGLAYAHRRGVVHRDLKPANIMLTDEHGLKIMDFGIARVLGAARLTRAGSVIGTIEYMPPEQVRGEDTDARSDIYSLGVVLYEALTGRTPFASTNEYELMRMQIEQPPPDIRDLAAHTPEPIRLAIGRALAKNPAERFATAAEFRQALTGVDHATAGESWATNTDDRHAPATPTTPDGAIKETRHAPNLGAVIGARADAPLTLAPPRTSPEVNDTARATDGYAAAPHPASGVRAAHLPPADSLPSKRRTGLIVGGSVAAGIVVGVVGLISLLLVVLFVAGRSGGRRGVRANANAADVATPAVSTARRGVGENGDPSPAEAGAKGVVDPSATKGAAVIPAPADRAAVRAELVRLEDEWNSANLNGDAATLDRILATEFIGTTSGRRQTKAQVLAAAKPDPNVTGTEIESAELVSLEGDRATLKGVLRAQVGKRSLRFRFTDKFVWRGRVWQATSSDARLLK